MPGRPYILAEAAWKNVRGMEYEVAVLPWGATEPHNYHLPFGTDNYESTAVADRAAELAWNAGAKVIVLPGVPFGVNTGQLDLKLTVNMNPSTQLAVLADVAESLSAQGIPKLVIINGHGGNDFRQMIRELQPKFPLFISTINWWSCLDAAKYFDEPGDHAGELETSVMMQVQPGLVLPLDEAGIGEAKRLNLPGHAEGWAWAPRHWTKVTEDTGVGNPAASSAEKGKRYLDAVTRRIADYLIALASANLDDLYV